MATAVRAVCRFHKNGNIFKYRLPRRHLNVTPDLENKLCSYELLYEMRCLPLARRVTIVRQRYDVDLSPSALGQIYRRNGIRFNRVKKVTRLTDQHEAKLMNERAVFARKLA